MAKKFVKISLAVKFRLLIGIAAVGIILAALVFPWIVMELAAEQQVRHHGEEVARLAQNRWDREHGHSSDVLTDMAELFALDDLSGVRTGPRFVTIKASAALDPIAQKAVRAFQQNLKQDLVVFSGEDEQDEGTHRLFRRIRTEPRCMECHRAPTGDVVRLQPGEFVGMIDLTLPPPPTPKWLPTVRLAFATGGLVAGLLAFVLFAAITQRLVLRPVRILRDIADRVADGDLSIRSTLDSGDELQHLGDSFNSMLSSIGSQTNRLRAANRALDLKLGELSEANVALFEANKVKAEFLANISHELRTPLNSIIGFADLLADASDDRIRRYGQNISSSSKSLLAMINDLLDLAKIEGGKTTVRLDKVSVSGTCQTLVTLIQPLADQKQLSVRLDLAEDLPIITTDGGKLQQILYNLLSNAVKFTPANGGITVTAGLHKPQIVSIVVADTGPGISEAEQNRIFEKFYQADSTLAKQSTGTGLGLAIAKELANLLGGRLTVASSPGAGATFTLTLPVDPKPANGADAADSTDSDPR